MKYQEMENEEEKIKSIYACVLCKKIFKGPGMCPGCNAILRKQAG